MRQTYYVLSSITRGAAPILAVFAIWVSLLVAPMQLWSQPTCTMACNGLTHVSLGQSCTAVVTANMILQQGSCAGPKTVTIMQGNTVIGNTVDINLIGQTLMVKVTDTNTGNSCWGGILVLDERAPTIDCTAKIVPCGVGNLLPSNPAIGSAIATDNCGSLASLTYTDVFTDHPCGVGIYTAQVARTWIATDQSGNTASCVQSIFVKRALLSEVIFPDNRDGILKPVISCENPITDPSFTGEPTVDGVSLAGYCDLQATSKDMEVQGCGTSKTIMRTWTVFDWCTNSTISSVQIIRISDTRPPTIVCPSNITANTSTGTCRARVVFPPATVSDNCNAVTVLIRTPFGNVTGNGGVLTNIPLGSHTITYVATDACGNSATCTTILRVEDKVVPVAICIQNTTTGLGGDGFSIIEAIKFNSGSYDNCELDKFEVKRITQTCGQSTAFGPSVRFDCCDIGKTIRVCLRVYDKAGNFNECFVDVEVQDKLRPDMTCPPNVNINCSDDIKNLTLTGSPIATDNCGLDTLFYSDNDPRTKCKLGEVIRTFTAVDHQGNSATCSHVISIVNQTPFSSRDITWPLNYTTDTCSISLLPKDLPLEFSFPRLRNTNCGDFLVNFTDERFDVASPACFKILRTWTVIDCCVYDANNPNSLGRWSFTQTLIVRDIIKPIITFCPGDQNVGSLESNCGPTQVNLPSVTATDCSPGLNITYTIDFGDNNSIDFSGLNANASGLYPMGRSKVTFTVSDGCGNVSTCSFIVTVVDAKKPTAICHNGLSVSLMQTGMVSLTSDQVNAGSFDNCTKTKDLTIVLTPNTFTCAELGPQTVRLSVTDLAGNTDFCTAIMVIQDNMGMCTTPRVALAGGVTNENGDPIQNVEIKTNGVNPLTRLTDVSGSYLFDRMSAGYDYTLTPLRNLDLTAGVDTRDLSLIQSHILKSKLLNSPFKIIAGDVNKDGRVTATDVAELRKAILGVSSTFPNNSSWRFVDKKYVFADPTEPLKVVFPEILNLNNVSMDRTDLDFTAIKVGDVNNSFSMSGTQVRGQGDLDFVATDVLFRKGQELSIPISTNFEGVDGFQFTLEFDPAKFDFVDIENGILNEANYSLHAIQEGKLTTSWNTNFTTKLNQHNIFTLKLIAKEDGLLSNEMQLTSSITKAKGFDSFGTEKITVLNFQNSSSLEKGLELFQNMPNPMSSTTEIGFSLPKDAFAKLTILDITGKIVYQVEGNFQKGINTIKLEKSNIGSSGVLMYRLEAEGQSAIKKMIVLN
jgi:hypothetical protein